MVRGMDEKSTLEGTGKMRFQDIPETKMTPNGYQCKLFLPFWPTILYYFPVQLHLC